VHLLVSEQFHNERCNDKKNENMFRPTVRASSGLQMLAIGD